MKERGRYVVLPRERGGVASLQDAANWLSLFHAVSGSGMAGDPV